MYLFCESSDIEMTENAHRSFIYAKADLNCTRQQCWVLRTAQLSTTTFYIATNDEVRCTAAKHQGAIQMF